MENMNLTLAMEEELVGDILRTYTGDGPLEVMPFIKVFYKKHFPLAYYELNVSQSWSKNCKKFRVTVRHSVVKIT